MKTKLSALVTLSLLGTLLAGCGNAASTAPSKALVVDSCVRAEGRAGAHVYVFSTGSNATSRVERTIRSDGSETLTGVTSLRQNKLIEYAEINPKGHLVYADVSLKGPGSIARRLIVDVEHSASFTQDELGSGWKHLSTETPIIYASFSDGADDLVLSATPVSAWLTLRASESSEDIRVIDPTRRTSQLIPADQLVVNEANEHLIITGETVLTANADFITSLGDATAEPLRLANISVRPHITASR